MARPNKSDEWLTASSLLIIKGWARDGLTNKEIAKNMGIRAETLSVWAKRFSQLSQALKEGRAPVNVQLEDSMIRSTEGYWVDEWTEEWVEDAEGNVTMHKKKKQQRYIQPNATMQIFMATNRMPEKYKHKRTEEIKVEAVDSSVVDRLKAAVEERSDEARL